jgi:hypothetical protein
MLSNEVSLWVIILKAKVSLRAQRGNLIKRNEFFIRDYHVASLLVMTKGMRLPRCARNDTSVSHIINKKNFLITKV